MVGTLHGCFWWCVLLCEVWVLTNHSNIICWSTQNTVHRIAVSVKCIKLGCWGYPSLASVQYSCPCLLSIQVSRLPFSATYSPPTPFYLSQTFTPVFTFFLHPKLPPVRFCPLPFKGFKQLLLVFTIWHLLQRSKRVNNESDDGGGSDGRPLWFN